MELLITAITLTIFIGLFISPIVLFRLIHRTNIKYKFITYFTIGIVLAAIVTFVLAWWAYTSDLILLKHYGYNIEGMNETEFYGKVLPENMDTVKSLETSIMGIGWPLKASLTFLFYLPYLLIVYGTAFVIGRKSGKNKRKE